MNKNSKVMLITQTRIKPDKNDAFEHIIQKINKVITTFPGYISQEIHRPNPPLQLDWIIIQHFDSTKSAKSWLQSPERHNILKEALPFLIGLDNVYIMQPDKHDQGTATATIANIIDPKDEPQFLDWQLRIAPIQSTFPGFIGYKLERPQAGINESWVAVVTFDTKEHLESWLESPQRKHMLKELSTFAGQSNIEKVYEGFDFWFTNAQRSVRSVWKENMLVLLTLYPVVFLLSYIQNPAMAYGVPFWLALFFSNLISTIILGSFTVPWLMQKFEWWLKPKNDFAKIYTIWGTLIVLLLYAIALCACWLLSRI